MGLVSYTIDNSGRRALADSSTVFECFNTPDNKYTYTTHYIEPFNAKAGFKYVLPLRRGSSCSGMGIDATLSVMIDGNYWPSITGFDMYLENMVTGQKVDISGAGCKSIIQQRTQIFLATMLSGDFRLVIESSKNTSINIYAYAGFVNPNSEYDLARICGSLSQIK